MANKRLHIPRLSAIRVGSFVFDRTRSDQLACAKYILAAPFGARQARMRNLLIAGYKALEEQKSKQRPAHKRDDHDNSND